MDRTKLETLISEADKVELEALLIGLYEKALDMSPEEAMAYTAGVTIQFFKRLGLVEASDLLDRIFDFSDNHA